MDILGKNNKIRKQLIRFKWPLIIIASMFTLALIGYLFILFGGKFIFDEEAVILPRASKVVAEDGTLLGKLYTENRDFVTIDQIPDYVEEAFLALEDRRFYQHAGVSFPAVARAITRDIIAMEKVEGGSTITQQLAKNLFLVNDKTWMRKTKEVMASIYLERNYTKKNILELYLNEVYFAHGIYGVGTASDYFFGKTVEELTIDEAALLAAMIKAPNTYSPYINIDKAKERRNVALQAMEAYGTISTEEMLSYQTKNIDVQEKQEEQEPWLDDYFAYVLDEVEARYDLSREELKRGGYTIQTHIDPFIQEVAYKQIQEESYSAPKNENKEYAFVLMEQETGHLTALIAGKSYELGGTNHLRTRLQPGSLMKPIAVYGPAMELGMFGPYDYLKDEDVDYNGYRVNNANNIYDGEIMMYDAIVQSKNAPAVWTLNQVGIDYSKTILEKMHISIEDEGLAIALGGLQYGLTPIEVTEAYRPFIHHGKWTQAQSINKILDKYNKEVKQESGQKEVTIFDKQVAWNILRMLEDVVKEGTAKYGEFSQALAGKTGSTQHPIKKEKTKDAWFTGITPSYVVTTWIGFDEATEANYMDTSSDASVRLTKSILSEIHKHQELESVFKKPDDVDELEEPIELPTITDLTGDVQFGGVTLVKGKLQWTPSDDERVVYRIYRRKDEEKELVGEVTGIGEYTINRVNIFKKDMYYVVPYNSLTNSEGTPSNAVTLSFDL